jgi:1,4-alpha-glucan branching enzyme
MKSETPSPSNPAIITEPGAEEGYVALLMHAHLPFVRHTEYKDSLEENWFYEAISDCYVPLLCLLDRLAEQEIDFRLTLSITPTLGSMLADPFLCSRYIRKLKRMIQLAGKEARRTRSDPKVHALARMYRERFQQIYDAFVDRYDGNLLRAFARLQQTGTIELIASAATHGYLPLLSVTPSSVRAQIRVGIEAYREFFGRDPQGFWLPECGYYPGIDEMLVDQGIRYTILETHGVLLAKSRPKYGVYAPVYCPSGLAAFGRDPESSKQVWSATEGYPGDPDYREFYRDIGHDLDLNYIGPYIHRDGIRIDTGLKYYRITGRTNHKELYVPEWAEIKAEIHASDFIAKKAGQIRYLASRMDRKPIIVAPYDAELFGHWWYEGPRWLEFVLRKTASDQQTFRLITPSEYLREYPVNQTSCPSPSSWGDKGSHRTWLNEDNHWIYRHLHQADGRMRELAGKRPRARGLVRRALNQAARELLLAQTSDWAFIMTSGTMTQYAESRTKTHLLNFSRLCRDIEEAKIEETWLAEIEHRDNIFPHIRYQSFL